MKNNIKKEKKEWLWFMLSDWLLKDGKKIRNNAAKNWLKKNNPNHPFLRDK